MSQEVAAVILAAGKGTRMKSEQPKCLHSVCGVPMADLVGRAMAEAGVGRRVLVIGHGGDLLKKALGDSYEYATQENQLGTGDAAKAAAKQLNGFAGLVIVSPGDTPLIDGEAIRQLLATHQQSGASATVGTVRMADPTGYGRVLRNTSGNVEGIVEHKDASNEQRTIDEINTGIFCFNSEALFTVLPKLTNDNSQAEFYLTDAVHLLSSQGGEVAAHVFNDPDLMMGVNDRWQLAQAAKALRMRILRRHAMSGVTIIDPDSTFVGPDVQIAPDSVLQPFTILEGKTKVGSECVIGPYTRVNDSEIGVRCTVNASQLNRCKLGNDVRCGPYANIRPYSNIGESVKIGNFVEIKNASMGKGAAASHLSYIGDGSVGEKSNIGAGTIFCNYDGFDKNQTIVGDNAFVGSNTTLVAPVTIGDGAMIAAGSVITQDVPAEALGLGRSRQEVKEGWASKWRKKKQTGE